MEHAVAAVADPEDVEEDVAGEDLVVVGPGAKISRIFAQLEPILKILSRNCCISIK